MPLALVGGFRLASEAGPACLPDAVEASSREGLLVEGIGWGLWCRRIFAVYFGCCRSC